MCLTLIIIVKERKESINLRRGHGKGWKEGTWKELGERGQYNSILVKNCIFKSLHFLDRAKFDQNNPLIMYFVDKNLIVQINILICLSLLSQVPLETAIQY